MCGIAGFIGNSKNYQVSFDLISRVFYNLEERGKDASGYWGMNEKNHVLFNKKSINSSSYTKLPEWNRLKKHSINLLIVHARKASVGMGDPSDNNNNHPFSNESKTLALIHNGQLSEKEYISLKKKYKTKSKCDSELIFKEFESESNKLYAIKKIFEHVKKGSMAVAAVRNDRNLWIFRNLNRPLYVFDLREDLGQIYFVSTLDLWEKSIRHLKKYNYFFKNQKFIEVPENQIWQFSLENSIIFKKFQIRKS